MNLSSSDEESEVNALSNATIGEFLMTERKLRNDPVESEATSNIVSNKSDSPSEESTVYEEVRL